MDRACSPDRDKWMSLLGDVETLDRQALESIDISLPILASYSDDQIEKFLEFERVYREQVKWRHRRLSVPSFKQRLSAPIEDLYITPQLEVAIRGQDPVKLVPPQFLLYFMHTIVLGDPGAGKSTLVNKICHDLARGQWSGENSDAGLAPLLVVLRDYIAAGDEARRSFKDYLTYNVMPQYQLDPPEGMVDFLFAAGRGVVLFDGLDEILAPAARREVVREIELFASKYPYVPVIVASRTVGYDEMALDTRKFARCLIDAFSDPQVKEYISLWFSLQADLSRSEQLEAVRDFMAASGAKGTCRKSAIAVAAVWYVQGSWLHSAESRPALRRMHKHAV